jgi:MYXO-CTERM domain-containing protein
MSFETHEPRLRLGRYVTLAALGGAATAANAEVIVSSAYNGHWVGLWSPADNVQLTIDGLAGGINIRTRYANGGSGFVRPTTHHMRTWGYVGVEVQGSLAGFRVKRNGGADRRALLAAYGATQGMGESIQFTEHGAAEPATFANVNLAYGTNPGRYWSGTNFMNRGNEGFHGTSKYLLFHFDNNGQTNYGWIEILESLKPHDGQYAVRLGDWAYDDSGVAITAGQTSSGTPAVPGPAGLAVLAMGAAGVRRKRDR